MELVSTHIVLNDDIGVRGNLYGGKLMAWIDDASSAYAREGIKSEHSDSESVGMPFSEAFEAQ